MKNIYRKTYMDKLISLKDKQIIKVITGIRRAGKSTILKDFYNYLIKNDVDKKNIIFINFDDANYKYLLDADKLHEYVISNTDESKNNYIILDEIQNVPNFQKCIDSLFLRDYLDIYITGSNSYMLSRRTCNISYRKIYSNSCTTSFFQRVFKLLWRI